jgi:Fe2+ transport system protein FeoA
MIREKLMSLAALEKDQFAIIVTVIAHHRTAKRLADLGLTPNTMVRVIRKTLFGGALEIKVRGSNLILGKAVATKILVNRVWKNQK